MIQYRKTTPYRGTVSTRAGNRPAEVKHLEQTIADLAFRLDRDFEILHLSAELARQLGYESPEQLLYYAGTSLLFSLEAEDIPAFRDFARRCPKQGAAENCFVRLRTREGSCGWYVLAEGFVERQGQERVLSCRCCALMENTRRWEYLQKEQERLDRLREQLLPRGSQNDIRTEAYRQTGTAALALGETLPNGYMEQFVDTLPCGMLVCEYWADNTHLEVRFFNDTFCRLTGCSTGELWAFRGRQLITELVAQESLAELENSLAGLCAAGGTKTCELELRRPGAVQWVRVTATVSPGSARSSLIRVALLDMSREKRSEEKVFFQNYCLERLNDSLFFGIIVKELGLEEKPLYMSSNIEAFLQELLPGGGEPSFSYRDLIHPADYPAVQAAACRCEQEKPHSYELEFRLRVGVDRYRWIKMMGTRLDDFGADRIYLLTFFDISSVKEAQEQLRIREEEYRIAVLHSRDIIVRLNMADHTVYVPREVARQYHMPDRIENMPGALVENGCIQPESIAEYLAFYEKIRQGQNCTVEIRSRWFGEKIRWFRGVATVIAAEGDQPLSAVLSFTDITGQKQLATEMKSLEESERMLETIVGNSPRMILKYQFEGDCFVPLTPPAQKILARIPEPYTPGALITPRYIAGESLSDAQRFFAGLRDGAPQNLVNIKVRSGKQGWRWYNCLHITSFSPQGRPVYALLFCEDITDKRRQELATIRLQDYTKSGGREILFNLEYNLTLDSFEGAEGMIPPCYQEAFEKSYTHSARRILEDVLPEYREDFWQIFDKERLIAALEQGVHSGSKELQILYENDPLWVRVFYQILKDPYTSFVTIWISCIDIHSEKQAQLHLMEMARLDPVTGGYNRAAFKDYVAERCALGEDGLNRALTMLDVDGFGRVNDVLGHAAGDQLLRDIADTLCMAAGSNDMVARVGGDEFAIYSSDFSDIIKAKERLRIIIAAVYRQVSPGLSVSISAGVAIYPRDGKTFDELYQKADLALYRAKITGRNRYVIYDETMAEMPAYTAAVPADGQAGRQSDVYIRTFGFFEVFICGEALLIHNTKAKELLALLVDRRGAYVSQGDIISCLWENESVNKVTLARLRKAAMLLRNVLKEHQLEELVESRKGFRRLNTKMVHCDLYDYLSQKPEYRHLYRGTYMANYSWGELTIDELERAGHDGEARY